MRNEETEQLDEMPESSMKTRDVHNHLKKSGWALARSSGGHDVYKHPKAKHSIPVPRHNQLKAPLIRGIMKASRVSEEAEIQEQLYKKGKFVSGPVKKPYKSPTIVTPIREAKDSREYDYEGDMATSQLRSMIFNAEDLIEMMDDNTNLPEWVQSKITLAEDYISTAANYLRGELTEAANPAQQAAIAINMKKKGIKPKNEEVELTEGRPSQRHPLEGHEYHKKSNDELIGIAKDAHAAAEAMKGHSPRAENKYRDQANDSATVRYWRQKNGMPDWYRKKYGHIKEETLDEIDKSAPQPGRDGKISHSTYGSRDKGDDYFKGKEVPVKPITVRKMKKDTLDILKKQGVTEEVEQIVEVAAWQRKEGKSESGGLNRKGIESYRRENPGSKLSMAVTTKPSKLKPGSKAANRRKSFCARMGGMKKRLTSAKTANDPDSRINKALRKWNC